MTEASDPPALLAPGTRVEVRNAFDGTWGAGFAVAAIEDDRYLLRRRSDGDVLPVSFDPSVVRREHRSMWWV
jgi:hypothetical protein